MSKPDDDIGGTVRRLLREASPAAPEILPDDLKLGPDGLGFDSVRVVELLLACEDHFGVAFPAELLAAPLTIGMLVAHARDARP